MRYSTLLVSSVATLASAIDIRFHSRNFFDCNGQWFEACVGANPNFCCYNTDNGGGSGWVSIAAIPRQWSIIAVGAPDQGCGYQYVSGSNNGTPDICLVMNGGNDADDGISSVFYYFTGSKRSASGEVCTGSQRTNFVSMGPGVQFDLQHVGEQDYQRFVSNRITVLLLCLLLTVVCRWQSTGIILTM
jgi:hypothetical protein